MVRLAIAAAVAALALNSAAFAGPNDPLPVPDKKAQTQAQMGPSTPAANPTINTLKPRKAMKSKAQAKAGKKDLSAGMKAKTTAGKASTAAAPKAKPAQ
jgi:hypothetical protein